MNKCPRPPEGFDENPFWTDEMHARARPASEVHGEKVAAQMVRKRGRPAGSKNATSKEQITIAAFAVPAAAEAKPCKDAKGKFIKCPPAPAATHAAPAAKPAAAAHATTPAKPATTHRCRDAKGRFARCGTPGAK